MAGSSEEQGSGVDRGPSEEYRFYPTAKRQPYVSIGSCGDWLPCA